MKSNIQITKEEYLELLLKEAKLEALEDKGVHNWELFDEAIEDYFDREEEIEDMVEGMGA